MGTVSLGVSEGSREAVGATVACEAVNDPLSEVRERGQSRTPLIRPHDKEEAL